MADEIVKRWDLTEIRLDARYYFGHEPDTVILGCRSLSLVPPKFHLEHGADGSVQRSVSEPEAILAAGIDVAALRRLRGSRPISCSTKPRQANRWSFL
jgi:hypothetical protein